MKNITDFLFGLNEPENTKEEYKTNLKRLLKRLAIWVLLFTCILWSIIFWLSYKNNAVAHLTFLAVASACLSVGVAFGFLFGIPRAVKIKTTVANANVTAKENLYDDNTNLEEISDWLTKIIVGLTLIKFNTILGWVNRCALSVGATLSDKKPCLPECTDYYVFSYAVIVTYFSLGLGACYLWTRIHFKLILVQNRKEQERLQEEKVETMNAKNKDVFENTVVGASENEKGIIADTVSDFIEQVKEKYKNTPVINKHKDDLQKGRWGGADKHSGWKLTAEVDPDRSFLGLYKLILTIKPIDNQQPLLSTVAFFLHDTFSREIVFVQPENGIARLELTSYEAFTVGAMLPDYSTLELDLNNVPGFPKGFYWTD